MSNPDHTWRLYGEFDTEDLIEFEIAATLSRLLPAGEQIDHWFDSGRSVYAGFGTPPIDSSIQKRICFICDGWGLGNGSGHGSDCFYCCNTGFTYHWIQTPADLIQASINGLQEIIDDLSGDHEPL